jgi:hypothetical protein
MMINEGASRPGLGGGFAVNLLMRTFHLIAALPATTT